VRAIRNESGNFFCGDNYEQGVARALQWPERAIEAMARSGEATADLLRQCRAHQPREVLMHPSASIAPTFTNAVGFGRASH